MRMPRFISYPSGRCPASIWLENRHAASAEAGAAPRPAPGAAPLLSDETLDLLLLISCLPRASHSVLMAALPALISSEVLPPPPGGRPASRPSHQRASWFRVSPLEFQRHRLSGLRVRLGDELAAGLSIVATPLWRLSRAKRNQALAARAEAIGQLAEALGRCPGSDPLEQELERALARLRR